MAELEQAFSRTLSKEYQALNIVISTGRSKELLGRNVNTPNDWDTKYSAKLTLNKLKHGVILSDTGSRFEYLGPQTAIELILQELLTIILYRLLFLLVRVEYWCTSQAARQGLAVLMAYASVVLKHETSTLRQSHNFISIDLKFGMSNNVGKVTSPAKFGSDPICGRDATWGQHIRVLWLFSLVFVFFILQQSYSPYPWTNVRAQ